MIRAAFFSDDPIVLQADSIKDKSGFLSIVKGVGTAMTTISESEISLELEVAL